MYFMKIWVYVPYQTSETHAELYTITSFLAFKLLAKSTTCVSTQFMQCLHRPSHCCYQTSTQYQDTCMCLCLKDSRHYTPSFLACTGSYLYEDNPLHTCQHLAPDIKTRKLIQPEEIVAFSFFSNCV